MTRTIPTICACCGELFQARTLIAAYCGVNCRRRAGYYRRQGRPIPAKGARWTKPLRPAVLQPEIIDDDGPITWTAPELATPAPLAYMGHRVRVITDAQGEPWFVAADALRVLTLDRKALERLDADEKGVSSIHTPGGTQAMTTVNEFGLYSLILGSRKPEARAFKRWVTHEVLPSIRRTGTYSSPTTPTTTPALPPGVHVVAASRREAAQIWWDAISAEVQGALARRLNPAGKSDVGLPMVVGYTWQPALF